MKASPDSFVMLIPHPWEQDASGLVAETYGEVWQARAQPTERGFSIDGVEVTVAEDEPLPQLTELAPTSLEPYGASALAMLDRHVGSWRCIAPTGVASAGALMKLGSSAVEAGASGLFLPGIRRLHSPRSVQRITMEIDPPSLTKFFVSAFDRDGWMRTRGLTPFGLPELTTPIDSGPNAAYFRLMDVSAAMIERAAPFPAGSTVQIGPDSLRIDEPPITIEDDIPVNGIHGVQALVGSG